MGLEIPPPDETTLGDMKYTWKATAEQKQVENGDVVTTYKYEIRHEDGTVTHRTVTDTNGTKSTEEFKTQASGTEATPERKPIEPPQGMPEHGTFEARRVIFTDEDGVVTTTINYTVYTEEGKWSQKEVHKDGCDVEVTKGKIEPLTEEDIQNVIASAETDGQPQQQMPTINVPPPRAPKQSALSEATNAKPPPKPDASASKPVEDPYLAARREPRRDDEPPVSIRPSIRARGSVADRYLKNLK